MISNPGSAHSPVRRTWPWWLGQGALYVLLWASLFKLPLPPGTDLDTSWQMVLGYAADHGLQHGKDIVFTYGPLGYLMAACYTGALFGHYIGWQIVSNLLIAAGLYHFGRNLPGWRRALYYLYLFWFGSMYIDAMQMNFIAIFGLMLAQPAYRRTGWITAIAAAFAVFSLIKFTHLMLCAFLVVTLATYYVATRQPRQALLLAGVFVGAFLGGWLACGQSLANLPAFLYYGLQLSLGYSGAMGAYEETHLLLLGLSALAAVATYLPLYFFSSRDRRHAGFITIILAAVVFINWKHGFTRADGHMLAHFVAVLLVVCAYPALTDDNLRWPRAKNAVLAAGGLACLVGAANFVQQGVLEAPSNWNYRLRDTFTTLLHLPHYRDQLDLSLRLATAKTAKPVLKAYIGNETVDHLGADQAYTVLNRLNYTPRPAVQGYTAYTGPLNQLDEAFYRSVRAPRFAIQRYDSIDGRLIALDDSLTQKLIYQNYDYVLDDGGLLVWERPRQIIPPDPAQEKSVLTQTVHFGEEIVVPDVGDAPVWAVVHIAQNLPGRLRQFLYKPPTLSIQLEDNQGMKHERLFVGAMGAAGFILQPFFPNSDELIAYQNGRAPQNIRRFSLHVMPGGEAYYQDGIAVELRTIAPFKRAANGLLPSAPHRFRMMNRVPVHLAAASPITEAFMEGQHRLQLQPPGVLEFAIDQPVASLRATIGIMPGAWDRTDGVNFIVEWRDASGKVERLGSRLLDPRHHLADREQQVLTADLGGRRQGTLLVRTEPGPTGNRSFGWSYLTGLEIR